MPAYKNLGPRNRKTPQTMKSDPAQVANNAGGFSFAISNFDRLDRFLILGADAPTYYQSAQELSLENAKAVQLCLKEDGIRTVDRIVEISDEGRAARNDAALFALAMACSDENDAVRAHALASLPKVARIGTHLFNFAEYVESFRGWGRALKRAVANWYLDADVQQMAYQVVKYRQRDGWTHRDMLRLSHPKTDDRTKTAVFNWVCGRPADQDYLPNIVIAYEEAKANEGANLQLAKLIREENLPREAVPTSALNDRDVWQALLEKMPMTALIRNLGKMSTSGIDLFKPMSENEQNVVARLTDVEQLHKARIHPMAILFALTTYKSGRGIKGDLSWNPNRNVLDALDDAFYKSFKNIEPTGKRHLLALDISGSMTSPIMNSHLSARAASAAMALVTMKAEPVTHVIGFTSKNGWGGNKDKLKNYWEQPKSSYSRYDYGGSVSELDISRCNKLSSVVNNISSLPMGRTDCALPMIYAMNKGIEADVFVVYTDNETYAGNIHPHEALRDYRRKTGIDAKLVVVGMTSTGFSIANPNDSGMLDVVGFDSAAPSVIANFVR